MRNKLLTIFLLALAAVSCKEELVEDLAVAPPCTVTSDTTQVILKDYFPFLETSDTITVVVDPGTRPVSIVEVQDKGVKKALVVKDRTPRKLMVYDRTKAPFITTEKAQGSRRSFYVFIDRPVSEFYVLWQNIVLTEGKEYVKVNEDLYKVTVPEVAETMSRSYIRIFASNGYGMSDDILVPLSGRNLVQSAEELTRRDRQTDMVYSIMTDRFVDGKASNNKPLEDRYVVPKVDYWGGDVEGVTKTIGNGYFKDLGINTLEISPLVKGPDSPWGQNLMPYTKFSGYHGLWPYQPDKLDERFATEDEVRVMLDAAHENNMNVILDYVSGKIHVESPTYFAHPDWARATDDFLADLALDSLEVADRISDIERDWMLRFEFDGIRHIGGVDIPESYQRMLSEKLMDTLKLSMPLNGQVSGTYDAYLAATTVVGGSFEGLAQCISENLEENGWHNLVGNISGDSDKARYVSVAGGDINWWDDDRRIGWYREIGVTDRTAYDRLKMLHALNFTLPGVPVIYYGDEYGQAGANDPDNRRWMRFRDELNDEERTVYSNVRSLAHLRRGSMPLLFGDYRELVSTPDVFAFIRIYMGDYVITVLNKSAETQQLTLELPLELRYDGNSEIEVTLAPCSYKIIENK